MPFVRIWKRERMGATVQFSYYIKLLLTAAAAAAASAVVTTSTAFIIACRQCINHITIHMYEYVQCDQTEYVSCIAFAEFHMDIVYISFSFEEHAKQSK